MSHSVTATLPRKLQMLWECSGVRMYLYRPQDTMLKNMVASLAPSKCHSMIYHTIATVIKLKRCLQFSSLHLKFRLDNLSHFPDDLLQDIFYTYCLMSMLSLFIPFIQVPCTCLVSKGFKGSFVNYKWDGASSYPKARTVNDPLNAWGVYFKF